MKRSLLFAAASFFALTTPAAAQHAAHGTQQAPPVSSTSADANCTPAHAAMGHCIPERTPSTDPHAGHSASQAQQLSAPAGDPNCTPEHAAMGHCTPKGPPESDPHAGHATGEPEAQGAVPHISHEVASDPHAGHSMPQPSGADPHAGHAMPGMSQSEAPPVAPPPPEAFSGPEHAATTIFDPGLFLRKREEELIDAHGGYVTWMLLAEQIEYRASIGSDGYKWDIQGWYGGDYDKLWLKSEGEGEFGHSPEQAEVQALYSRSLDPWFNLQAGIRHDFRPDPERTHFIVGIQGLAPYWFEVDGQLFLSNKGDLTARFEAEYDQRITNKLILQPVAEFDLAAQDVPELGIGSGLSSAEVGVRLRYEFVPEFAPYIGVEYERSFGDTADFARAAGEDVGGWSFLVGLRSWF